MEESHSQPFAAFYDTHADSEWVSSSLLRIELTMVVIRVMPALLPDARDLLLALSSIAIDHDIVEGRAPAGSARAHGCRAHAPPLHALFSCT